MKKKGFTLIELLVVIAIIGILSTIGLVALNGAREKARDAQRQSDMAQYRTALALYYDDFSSRYPAQIGAATVADCILGDGTTRTHTPPNTFAAGAAANALSTAGVLIDEYLGSQLEPPTATATAGDSHYCYDTNDAASNISYVLYTQLEGGTQQWYWLDDTGNNGKAASTRTAVCSAQTSCAF